MTLTSSNALPLPTIEDATGAMTAVNQVLRHLANSRLDRPKAATLFYGLQIAASLVRKTQYGQPPGQTVRDVCEDEEEGLIAPESTSCEPPEDCEKCAKAGECKTWQVSQSEFPGDFFSPPPTYNAKPARSRIARRIARDEKLAQDRRELFRIAYGDNNDDN